MEKEEYIRPELFVQIIVKDTYAGDIRCVETYEGYEMYNNDTNEYYGKVYADLEDKDFSEEELNDIVSNTIRENEDMMDLTGHF